VPVVEFVPLFELQASISKTSSEKREPARDIFKNVLFLINLTPFLRLILLANAVLVRAGHPPFGGQGAAACTRTAFASRIKIAMI
jgi:hypothetical protein